MLKYFVLASECQLTFRWLKPSRRSYILSGIWRHCNMWSSDSSSPHSHSMSGSFWYPDFIMFAFILTTPALNLFNVLHIIHGWFLPHGKSSAGWIGFWDCSSSLHVRILCCFSGSWIVVELAIKLLRDYSLQ